jgi:hypothetical protein
MNKFSFTISAHIRNDVAIRYLVTLVVLFLILHIVDSDNSLFFRNNDVFLHIFGIKYVKHLCNSCSENPRFIFMTHICQSMIVNP